MAELAELGLGGGGGRVVIGLVGLETGAGWGVGKSNRNWVPTDIVTHLLPLGKRRPGSPHWAMRAMFRKS